MAPSSTGTLSTRSGSLCTSPSTLFELQTDPFLVVPLAAIGLGYLIGYRRFSRRSHSHSARGAIFLLGYTALVVALISPLHAVGEQLFSVHMIQHLLLTLVAPP